MTFSPFWHLPTQNTQFRSQNNTNKPYITKFGSLYSFALDWFGQQVINVAQVTVRRHKNTELSQLTKNDKVKVDLVKHPRTLSLISGHLIQCFKQCFPQKRLIRASDTLYQAMLLGNAFLRNVHSLVVGPVTASHLG